MLLLGMLLQDGPLSTLGLLGLLLVGCCSLLAPLNVGRLELQLDLPRRFHAGRPVSFEATLWNRRRLLDAYDVEIVIQFPQGVERTGLADWTPAGEGSSMQDRLRIPMRSSSTRVLCECSSRFPLGLFEVRRSFSVRCPFLVYPRLITPNELQPEGVHPDPMPTAGAAPGDSVGEPRGIRPYQPGDAANRIHQVATARSIARGHGIRARAFDPPGLLPDSCRIIFHASVAPGEMIRFDHFERGLSLVAGTLHYFRSLHTRVTLQASFTDWRPRRCETQSHYFECLALLAKTSRPIPTTNDELAAIFETMPLDEQIILISDSPPPSWIELVPTHPNLLLVDLQQIRFKKRQLRLANKS